MILTKKMSKQTYIYIAFLFIIVLLFKNRVEAEIILSQNGNFLFYNSPIITSIKEYSYLSFVDKMGKVKVKKYTNNNFKKPITSYLVHDYTSNIKAFEYLKIRNDDHSAPAIIYNPFLKKITLATSFHGSDLYLYDYSAKEDKFKLSKTILGMYTYPRFIKTEKEILLFVRKQYKKNSKWHGSLVFYKSSDNFTKEHLLLDTYPNSIIYASRPYYSNNIVYFAYATHDYDTVNMTGLTIIGWSTKSEKIILNLDLNKYLDKKYFYNRPTGLAVKKNKIIVATSFFNNKKNFKNAKLYTWTNTILILEVNIKDEDNIKVKILHKNRTKAPYYNTDIFIDKNFNWIYFDENKTVANKQISDECFHHKYMMYPSIIENSVYYVKVNNEHYSIRDFNNSIIQCQHYAK